MKVYETYITDIGAQAFASKEDHMMILFGENAPDFLKEFCFMVEMKPVTGEICEGMNLCFGDNSYKIITVGSHVMRNLNDLGHITIAFGNHADSEEMAGKLTVESEKYPEITIGTRISIEMKN